MDLIKREDQVYAIPAFWKSDLALLQKYLYVRKAGILLGKLTPKELIPHHEFAMSQLCSEKIKRLALDLKNAIQYLKKDEMNLFSGERVGHWRNLKKLIWVVEKSCKQNK